MEISLQLTSSAEGRHAIVLDDRFLLTGLYAGMGGWGRVSSQIGNHPESPDARDELTDKFERYLKDHAKFHCTVLLAPRSGVFGGTWLRLAEVEVSRRSKIVKASNRFHFKGHFNVEEQPFPVFCEFPRSVQPTATFLVRYGRSKTSIDTVTL